MSAWSQQSALTGPVIAFEVRLRWKASLDGVRFSAHGTDRRKITVDNLARMLSRSGILGERREN